MAREPLWPIDNQNYNTTDMKISFRNPLFYLLLGILLFNSACSEKEEITCEGCEEQEQQDLANLPTPATGADHYVPGSIPSNHIDITMRALGDTPGFAPNDSTIVSPRSFCDGFFYSEFRSSREAIYVVADIPYENASNGTSILTETVALWELSEGVFIFNVSINGNITWGTLTCSPNVDPNGTLDDVYWSIYNYGENHSQRTYGKVYWDVSDWAGLGLPGRPRGISFFEGSAEYGWNLIRLPALQLMAGYFQQLLNLNSSDPNGTVNGFKWVNYTYHAQGDSAVITLRDGNLIDHNYTLYAEAQAGLDANGNAIITTRQLQTNVLFGLNDENLSVENYPLWEGIHIDAGADLPFFRLGINYDPFTGESLGDPTIP